MIPRDGGFRNTGGDGGHTYAQPWTCKDCGLRQALVFKRGAKGSRAAGSVLLPCARCEAIHDISLPPDSDRESIRVANLSPAGPGLPCPVCAAPETRICSGMTVLALCPNGHQRLLDTAEP